MSQSNAKRGGKGAVGRYNTVQPMCSCNIYWSIILYSKLSDKFAKLSSSTTASTGRKNRKTAVVSNQKSNRNTQSNAKRGLTEKKMNMKGSAGAKPQGRRGGKGGWITLYFIAYHVCTVDEFCFLLGNKLAPKRDSGKKQPPKTSDDLDMEMDSCES